MTFTPIGMRHAARLDGTMAACRALRRPCTHLPVA
jgi:hypothetical protein